MYDGAKEYMLHSLTPTLILGLYMPPKCHVATITTALAAPSATLMSTPKTETGDDASCALGMCQKATM